jgi:hypothetical protein
MNLLYYKTNTNYNRTRYLSSLVYVNKQKKEIVYDKTDSKGVYSFNLESKKFWKYKETINRKYSQKENNIEHVLILFQVRVDPHSPNPPAPDSSENPQHCGFCNLQPSWAEVLY